MDRTGAYSAKRASALSGVPQSTIHYWSRTKLLTPSVSAERVKLWSWSDLMGLRIIYWLRQKKTVVPGAEIPRTGMKAIRRGLSRLREIGEPLGHPEAASLWIDADGEIHVGGPAGPETLAGQTLIDGSINLIAPFTTREGLRGPDLAKPRPELRIVPGRLSGSPHIVHTRLETSALFALDRDGVEASTICQLYPYLTTQQLNEALDLERQLEANLAIRVAASAA